MANLGKYPKSLSESKKVIFNTVVGEKNFSRNFDIILETFFKHSIKLEVFICHFECPSSYVF